MLAKDLIKGTPTETKILEWKKQFSFNLTNSEAIGYGWYSGFRKRYALMLKNVDGLVKGQLRASWCTYSNFENMYNHVYERMVDAGVAEKRVAPVYLEKGGKVVEDESLAFGLPSIYEIVSPEWILFVDEAGANTNQKKDGQVGCSRFVVDLNQVETGKKGCATDIYFTTLVFQAGTGAPVMVAIILK